MQTALKFFDLPFKGIEEQGVHKIGIKLPKRSAEDGLSDETGFMEILAALTQIPPRELSSSLAQLDWVPVADDTGELAPLIDLTGQGDSNPAIMKLLLPEGDGDSAPASGSAGPPEAKLSIKTGAPVSEAAPSLLNAAAALEKSSELQVPAAQNTGQNQSLDALPFQAIDAFGAATDPASIASRSTARYTLTDSAAETAAVRFKQEPTTAAAAASSGEPQASLSDGTKRSLRLRIAQEFGDGNGRTTAPTADGHAPMSSLKTVEPPMAHETPSHQAKLALRSSQPPVAGDADPAAERILAQEAGAHASASARDQRFGQTVRIENPSVRQDGGFPLKSIEDSKLGSNNASTREGHPSLDSRLTDTAPKAVEAESAAKEVMPFIEKDTHTDVIRQIVQRMTLRTEKQQSQMIIRLKPDFLGHVKLHVSTENQQVTVRMEAESSVVKDIVEQNMPHLKAELHQHGLHIEKFDVFVGSENSGWSTGQRQPGFRQELKRNGQPSSGILTEDKPLDRTGETDHPQPAYQGYRSSEVDYFA